MSGGSRNYFYVKLRENNDLFEAPDVNALIEDLAGLFHDEEWFQDNDISKEVYLDTLSKFRKKWILQTVGGREAILAELNAVEKKFQELRSDFELEKKRDE